MTYDKEIKEAFSKFGLEPRGNQTELIDSIVRSFILDKKENVVLSAPTGTGKSIIAAMVAEVLSKLDKSYDEGRKSFILMHNNTLVKQYLDTFNKYPKDFINVLGASNYECTLLNETAADCVFKETNDEKRREHCFKCEYLSNRGKMNNIPHIITNYSYYFIAAMYTHRLEDRLLTIYDEAHIINDVFSNHMQIKISVHTLEAMIRDLEKFPINNGEDLKDGIRKLIEVIEQGIINKTNYKSFLKVLNSLYIQIMDEYTYQVEDCQQRKDMGRFKIVNALQRKYKGLHCKIDDFYKFNYEHILDVQEVSIAISPIFFSDMFKQVKKSKYNLFMSATINLEFITKTLNLNKKNSAFIKSPPVFKPESKTVILVNHTNYNYMSLNNKTVQKEISELCYDIVTDHREKGIILTNSFKVNKFIAQYLKATNQKHRIIEHVQGIHLNQFLSQHKNSRSNSILISPSLFEGIDLPNKESEFQIFVKAPFPSLGDKRIKYIFDNYPAIYELMTIFKIIQGFGRSTRSADDFSLTYGLDANIGRLFNHKKNVWKDEFKVL